MYPIKIRFDSEQDAMLDTNEFSYIEAADLSDVHDLGKGKLEEKIMAIPYSLYMFTGFKDVDGMEIYEGDYVNGHDTVFWDQDTGSWMVDTEEGYTPLWQVVQDGAEVTGNILDDMTIL